VNAQKPREIAVSLLCQHAEGRQYLEDLFEQNEAKNSLSSSDRGLLQEITFGAVRWQATLDWLISRRTDGREQATLPAILLRLGLYQLLWLDRVPAHAAVHEMVEIAKSHGFGPQTGFINAILRSYSREISATKRLLKDLKASNPALGYSHPKWLAQQWKNNLGTKDATALMEWNNQPPPTYARLNRLCANAESLRMLWENEQVEAKREIFPWSPATEVYRLLQHPPIGSLESFRSGFFYIQDPSTLLAVEQLDPKPGDAILDLCSAPGGKTLFIAQKMSDTGRIVANDTSVDRLKMVEENCLRLGVKKVETALNAMNLPGQFDGVLIDAPCSNTGVMRRRVDLRWRIKSEEIKRLASVQLGLLTRGAERLKPDGSLVYSTCSLEREENEEVVQKFLEARPDFRLEIQHRLSPFAEGVDGAYAAKLIRT